MGLEPARLAEQAGISQAEAASFLAANGPRLDPAGVFDEVDPAEVLGAGSDRWGVTLVVGLCALGPDVTDADEQGGLQEILNRLVLKEALDFMDYRVRLYLKPTGRRPGPRLIPGCPELPLTANRNIIEHFHPAERLGLTVAPTGETAPRTGLAFVHPTVDRAADPVGLCARCTRRDCPSRISS